VERGNVLRHVKRRGIVQGGLSGGGDISGEYVKEEMSGSPAVSGQTLRQ